MSTPYRIFISYSHQDEALKDELCVHLKSLERKGLIAPWQDRKIAGGEDWRAEIEKAMQECDLGLLLVSPSFLASDFIQLQEWTLLQKRRAEQGIRLLPIILKPCVWTLEDIANIQARPRDGKAVITFSPDTGARDQAWTDIVEEIAGWAKKAQTTPAPAAAPVPPATSTPAPTVVANVKDIPYDPWQPALPPNFFGRAAQLQTLHRALDEQRSVAVQGDARIGKSSLLQTWALKVWKMGRAYAIADGQGAEHASCAALVKQWTGQMVQGDSPDQAADHLQAWAHKNATPGLPPLLMLDEADHILANFPLAFFERLRHLINEREICLLLASRHPAHELLQREGRTSPLANLLEILPLGLLTESEAGQMVEEVGQRFGAQIAGQVRHWCGRHPYYLSLLGRRVWEHEGDMQAALDQFCAFDAKGRLDEAWRALTTKEQQILHDVWQGRGKGNTELRLRGWLDGEKLFGEVLNQWLRERV